MKKEEAIQKAIKKIQNECDLLYYPVVCEGTVIDGVEEMSSALDNYQKKLAEHTDMWIICEMAKRWLEYLRDKKKSKQTTERPQWIPCSERLPKPNELVVASLKTGVQLCEYLADGSSDSWFSTTDNRFVYNRLIKAWMPLPEPYKGEGEKE